MSSREKKIPKPNMIDRAVSVFSPERAMARYRARAQWKMVTSAVSGGTGTVERKGAGSLGTLFNWTVKRLNRYSQARQREKLTDRAEDLAANDPHAVSCLDSMVMNVIGTGLNPQSRPAYKRLGIDEAAASEFAESAEWVWKKWCRHASADNKLDFSDLLFVNFYSLLMRGEYVTLPIMRDSDPLPGESSVRLALQTIHPSRLRSPSDGMSNPRIRDGILLDTAGAPEQYYIADPDDGRMTSVLTSKDFTIYPARLAHRPGLLHGFFNKSAEQVRGVSVLAPAMKFFRDMGDYLDFEVVGAIVASSFPLFIEKSSNVQDYVAGAFSRVNENDSDSTRYQEVTPGQILYGEENEKPHVLKNERPGNTFEGFVRTILRAVSASTGQPYEVVAKDFSQTNYSSARAALLEAWRVYMVYRSFMVRHFCRPVWDMVLEEAWLRGELILPKSGPQDFYEFMAEYCEATWIGPPRGHVDPVKEMKANIEGLENNIFTLADVAAEHGKDWESQVAQRRRERNATGDMENGENQG